MVILVEKMAPLLRIGVRLNNLSLMAFSSPGLIGTHNNQQQRRTIVHASKLVLPDDYPKPWPYKEKGYLWWTHGLYERTKPHLHTNSKIIVVESNIGAGKTSIAKELAEQLDFYYMPAFKMDHILVDRYGNDLRDYYHLFPKRFRMPDINMFYKNPYDDLTAAMQERIYYCKWEQWLNALAHVFNTGQGVVLERSVFSDFVFTNAMRAKDFIGSEFFKYYYFLRKVSLRHLHFYPHLVIYLDCPVWKCLENIKARGNEHEVNVVDELYLKVIEDSYKDSLRELKRYSKILAYDWTEPESLETIIDDIEAIDMDFFEWHSGDVWEQWFTIGDESHYTTWRYRATEKFDQKVLAFDDLKQHEVSELSIYPFDHFHYMNVIQHEILKDRFGYGFHLKKGDPIAATGHRPTWNNTPEPWYDYYWKEAWYDQVMSAQTYLDPLGRGYNPEYLRAH